MHDRAAVTPLPLCQIQNVFECPLSDALAYYYGKALLLRANNATAGALHNTVSSARTAVDASCDMSTTVDVRPRATPPPARGGVQSDMPLPSPSLTHLTLLLLAMLTVAGSRLSSAKRRPATAALPSARTTTAVAAAVTAVRGRRSKERCRTLSCRRRKSGSGHVSQSCTSKRTGTPAARSSSNTNVQSVSAPNDDTLVMLGELW
eukprot:10471-Heterococcus_DN1.PRE.1